MPLVYRCHLFTKLPRPAPFVPPSTVRFCSPHVSKSFFLFFLNSGMHPVALPYPKIQYIVICCAVKMYGFRQMYSCRYSSAEYHVEYFSPPPATCLPSQFYLFQNIVHGAIQRVALQIAFFHLAVCVFLHGVKVHSFTLLKTIPLPVYGGYFSLYPSWFSP